MPAEEADIITRLIGARQVTAGLTGEAAAMEELGVATDRAGLAMDRTTKRSWLMNQALFTMRRFTYMATLVVTGFAVAAVKWGFDFNNAMQQGRISLGALLGSTQAANKELRYLWGFAAYTPFQFKDIVRASQVLFAFHFTTQMTNRTLRNMTDALVATGRAAPQFLNRISNALGHMFSIGHATGQVLQQLARDGIPGVYDAIQKYFNLSPQQMAHIGQLGLPAADVVRAINQYIEQGPMHGLARKQALGSLHGVFTTFKDFTSQIFGDIEQRPFAGIQRLMTRLNPVLQRMAKGFETGGFKGMLDAMGDSKIADHIRLWVTYFTELWHIIVNGVVPAFRFWFNLLQPFTSVLWLMAGVLGVLERHMTLVKIALFILVTDMIVAKSVTLALAAAERWEALMELFRARRKMYSTLAMRANTFATVANMVATNILSGAYKFQILWLLRLNATMLIVRLTMLRVEATMFILGMRMAWTAVRMGEFRIAAMLASRAAWDLAVALYTQLIPAFLREAIAAGVAWAATLGPIAIVLGALAAVAAAIYLITQHWKEFKRQFSDPLHIQHYMDNSGYSGGGLLGNWLSSKGLPTWLTGAHRKIPGQASGGVTDQAGWSWVGERGPELRWMPKGAVVSPLNQRNVMFPMEQWRQDQANQPIVVQLMVDGKKLAEIVAKHKQDVRARA